MANTITLESFVSACIAEDEAVARAAMEAKGDGSPARWRAEPGRDGHGQSVVWNGRGQAVIPNAYHYQGEHVARFDPRRMLAECAAKRAIIALATTITDMAFEIENEWPSPHVAVIDGDVVLRALALPYAEHPDFDVTWRNS